MKCHTSCFQYGVASISSFLKLQVSFAEYSLFYRALLQKRPIILRSLLIVATPYHVDSHVWFIANTRTRTSHATHWNQLYQQRMSPVTHMNESRHTHEWVMSHTWMSHVTHMNESCHTQARGTPTQKWVKSHAEMIHVAHTITSHMNESRHTHE